MLFTSVKLPLSEPSQAMRVRKTVAAQQQIARSMIGLDPLHFPYHRIRRSFLPGRPEWIEVRCIHVRRAAIHRLCCQHRTQGSPAAQQKQRLVQRRYMSHHVPMRLCEADSKEQGCGRDLVETYDPSDEAALRTLTTLSCRHCVLHRTVSASVLQQVTNVPCTSVPLTFPAEEPLTCTMYSLSCSTLECSRHAGNLTVKPST